MHQFVIWWLFSLSGVVHASVQTCYFPDKTVAAADVPCNGASSTSACCNFNDVCLDNGLCLQSEGPALMSRGSCTDSTWSSNQCPQFCQDGPLSPDHILRSGYPANTDSSYLELRASRISSHKQQILLRRRLCHKCIMQRQHSWQLRTFLCCCGQCHLQPKRWLNWPQYHDFYHYCPFGHEHKTRNWRWSRSSLGVCTIHRHWPITY